MWWNYISEILQQIPRGIRFFFFFLLSHLLVSLFLYFFSFLNLSLIRPGDDFFKKLDSNVKRNTSFLKKIRQLSEDNYQSLITEMKQLNLSRYVSEIPDAIIEAKIRITDMNGLISFCSAIHERYAEFSDLLAVAFHKELLKISCKPDNPNEVELSTNFKVFFLFCVFFFLLIFFLREKELFYGLLLRC